MNNTPSSRPRPGQVLLGLFVVGQLGFLLAANFLPLLRTALAKQAPTVAQPIAVVLEGTGTWARWTGQLQGWSLYAPRVPAQAAFATVELRWDDDPHWPAQARRVVLHSDIEPANPQSYFRPFGTFRLPAYEADLSQPTWAWTAEFYAEKPEEWRDHFVDTVRKDWRPIQAYLAWRLRGWQHDQPDPAAPRQVVLLCRLYAVGPPGQRPWSWGGPVEQPVARWRPGHDPAAGFVPVDAYNPVTRRFEPVAAEEGPRDE
jgi:hypothetical protein